MCQPIQLIELGFLIILFLILGVFIHSKYPLPFIFADTNTYVFAAYTDSFSIYRPMGFSHYLQLLHSIVPTLGFYFIATYILYVLSSLILLFSAKYILQIKNEIIFIIMSLCAILSPRLLFSCNFVMSDGIFAIMAVIYMTLNMWLVKNKKWWWLIISFVILWWMCKTRYSGLFFIPISIFTIFFAYKNSKIKVLPYTLSILPLLFALLFYVNTKNEYYKETHIDTFSGFAGWQKINNVSVLFPEAKELKPSDFKNNHTRRFHRYMQSVPDENFKKELTFGTGYMWNNNLQYKQYLFESMDQTGNHYGEQWIRCGVLFAEYSDQVIGKYPFKYFTKFILPSVWSNTYFYPFTKEYTPLKNEKMYQEYYGVEGDGYDQGIELFTATDPFRKVSQNVYWIAAVIAAIFFCTTIRRNRFNDASFTCAFMLLLSFVTIIGAQAISSPNSTWRYTMQFYQTSIVFMFLCLDWLVQALRKPHKVVLEYDH